MNTPFPVTYSILSSTDLLNELLPDYEIGDVAVCQFFSSGFNDTYRVRTVSGTTYYMRVYRLGWRMLPDILHELDVLEHLRRKNYPAARLLRLRDGSLYRDLPAPEGTRVAVLFSEAPGKLIAYDKQPDKVAFQYGQAVAGMHNALDDFSSGHARFRIDLDLLIDTPLRNIRPFLTNRPEDWSYLQDFAARLRQHILDLPTADLELGYCHGDLQGYHAHLDEHGILTFFDFDCGGVGYRSYDLAVFRWCTRLEDAEAVRWEPYLQGYRSTRSLADLDIRAIPLFVGARYIWHMGVHTQNAPDWGCGWLDEDYFTKKLACLKAVEQDYF